MLHSFSTKGGAGNWLAWVVPGQKCSWPGNPALQRQQSTYMPSHTLTWHSPGTEAPPAALLGWGGGAPITGPTAKIPSNAGHPPQKTICESAAPPQNNEIAVPLTHSAAPSVYVPATRGMRPSRAHPSPRRPPPWPPPPPPAPRLQSLPPPPPPGSGPLAPAPAAAAPPLPAGSCERGGQARLLSGAAVRFRQVPGQA